MTERAREIIKDKREELGRKNGRSGRAKRERGEIIIGKDVGLVNQQCVGDLALRGPWSSYAGTSGLLVYHMHSIQSTLLTVYQPNPSPM